MIFKIWIFLSYDVNEVFETWPFTLKEYVIIARFIQNVTFFSTQLFSGISKDTFLTGIIFPEYSYNKIDIT